jgi:pimeloyl-ACP methyl ester carboxylesterase
MASLGAIRRVLMSPPLPVVGYVAHRHGTAPAAPAPVGAPGRSDRVGEIRAAVQVPRLLVRLPGLAAAPRGDGRRVIDIPGWRTPEAVTAPLRAYLRWLGYDARSWGLGANRGDPERDAERLVEVIRDDAATVSLIGWSLGGVVAREVARAVPDRVRRVICYGSPVVGGPTFTVGARTYGREECERIARLIEETDAERPIRVPVTAIFTRRDGMVDWRACIDRASRDVEHVEVASTHLGLGIDPDVWAIVADRLARAPGGGRSG